MFSDVRKRRLNGRDAFVEKGPLKDDHVIISNVSYDPTTASHSGKISSSESTLSKLFIRMGSFYICYDLLTINHWAPQNVVHMFAFLAVIFSQQTNYYLFILPLRELMSHIRDIFDPYTIGSAFLALRSTPSVCNWCQE